MRVGFANIGKTDVFISENDIPRHAKPQQGSSGLSERALNHARRPRDWPLSVERASTTGIGVPLAGGVGREAVLGLGDADRVAEASRSYARSSQGFT